APRVGAGWPLASDHRHHATRLRRPQSLSGTGAGVGEDRGAKIPKEDRRPPPAPTAPTVTVAERSIVILQRPRNAEAR
ncbi:hypothetical protein RZS08_09210, partial [Arthrospira platensis SPKY1]|nr:hypothetical protein [Arthrospira platensis SPKY1]